MSFLPSCSENKGWLLSLGSDAREEISAVTVPAGDRAEISLSTFLHSSSAGIPLQCGQQILLYLLLQNEQY